MKEYRRMANTLDFGLSSNHPAESSRRELNTISMEGVQII